MHQTRYPFDAFGMEFFICVCIISQANFMITLPDDKQLIIDGYAQHKGDTGSPEVQIALLSQKIQKLSSHLDENKKDNHSRRGLLKVIAKRRRILGYLQKLDEARYQALILKLDLRK